MGSHLDLAQHPNFFKRYPYIICELNFQKFRQTVFQKYRSAADHNVKIFTLKVFKGTTPSYVLNEMKFYMEQGHPGFNQMRIFIIGTHDVIPCIYYHCNGVLLASVTISWMNFLQGRIHFCMVTTINTPFN